MRRCKGRGDVRNQTMKWKKRRKKQTEGRRAEAKV
jgi:hypothetical protein